MSEWKKCSDALPPTMVPVLVAWDGSTQCRWTGVHYSAVIRDESDLNDRGWDWFEYEADCSCDWDDDELPTHWMPWPSLTESDEHSDSELFRFWVSEASRRPSRIAVALANCVTPDDYRMALRRLQETE